MFYVRFSELMLHNLLMFLFYLGYFVLFQLYLQVYHACTCVICCRMSWLILIHGKLSQNWADQISQKKKLQITCCGDKD